MSSSQSLCILLPDGEFWHALKVVRCLARSTHADMDVTIHACTTPVVPDKLRRSRHVAGIHPIPTTLPEEARMQAIAEVARRVGADVVLPMSTEGSRLLARHDGLFDDNIALAPLSSEVTQRLADDKGLLAEFMAAHDVPHPPATGLYPLATLRERLDRLSFPVLVKATVGKGGHRIFRFERPAEVIAFAEHEAEADREYIVQTYVEGDDVDVSVLAVNGTVLAHTIQQALTSDRERPYGPPNFIEFLDEPMVEAVGRRLVSALGFTGLAHIDLRYDADRRNVYVLEINTRVWGSILGSLRAGINFPQLACLAALGRPMPPLNYQKITFSVGKLALKRLWRTVRQGVPLRQSCVAFALDDPAPDLIEFAWLKWDRIKRLFTSRPSRKRTRPEEAPGQTDVSGASAERQETGVALDVGGR